jgi:predicted MFS family arabinose efflux permease
VLTVSGLIGITMHAPIGALIDATRRKRALIVLAVLLLAVAAIAIERAPTGPVVLSADILMAILGAIFAPTVAAITLGVVAPPDFAKRIGRNAVFDRIGNIFITAIAGTAGWWFGQRIVFYLVPLFALPAIIAVLAIPPGAIDHVQARGLEKNSVEKLPQSWWSFITTHRDFVLLCSIAALFHFANASLLPLIGQKLALANPGKESALVAACIMVAQLSTIPAAMFVTMRADKWGHGTLLALACLAAPMRALAFAIFDDPVWLISAQVLDGFGGGMFDTLLPIVLADIMRGSGRYNVSRGVLGTVQGVGGSTSNLAGGLLVVSLGYNATFAVFAVLGLAALGLAVCTFRKSVALSTE